MTLRRDLGRDHKEKIIPNRTREEIQQWFRWTRYVCTALGVSKGLVDVCTSPTVLVISGTVHTAPVDSGGDSYPQRL
jgi:hypothetical protein